MADFKPLTLVNADPIASPAQELQRSKTRHRDDPAAPAREFESILLGQWLQAAESSFATVPGGDEAEDDEDEQMKSYGVQQLANALSHAGGIGIASMVTRALTHNLRQEPTPSHTLPITSR